MMKKFIQVCTVLTGVWFSIAIAPRLHAQTSPAATEHFTFTVSDPNVFAPGGDRTFDLVVNHWSTDAERDKITSAFKNEGPAQLARVVHDFYDAGYMHWPGQLDYTLRYARKTTRPDGSQDLTLIVDYNVWTGWMSPQPPSSDDQFTLIQVRIPKDGAGVGKISAGGKLAADTNMGVTLANFDTQPVVLNNVQRATKS